MFPLNTLEGRRIVSFQMKETIKNICMNAVFMAMAVNGPRWRGDCTKAQLFMGGMAYN